MDKLDRDIKDIIKDIQSYENEEACIIILTQRENKALLNYINILEKDRDEYYNRVMKTLDYIENESVFSNIDSYELFNKMELINILTGEDNETKH